jgi:hypothetical protein
MPTPGQELTQGSSDRTPFPQKTSLIPALIAFLLLLFWELGFLSVSAAQADGGGGLPTSTPPLATPLPATSLPPIQFTPTLTSQPAYPMMAVNTPEVKSFEIVIDSDQNATVQAVAPDNQAALSRAEALEAQANASTQEEGFASPLWVFGFIILVIIIVIINSVARGFRSHA